MNFSAFIFLLLSSNFVASECDLNSADECDAQERRYLVYGVNFGEGFNLRRDVYLRISNVVRQLREKGRILGVKKLRIMCMFRPQLRSRSAALVHAALESERSASRKTMVRVFRPAQSEQIRTCHGVCRLPKRCSQLFVS